MKTSGTVEVAGTVIELLVVGSGDLVVLLPGGGFDGSYFGDFAQALARRFLCRRGESPWGRRKRRIAGRAHVASRQWLTVFFVYPALMAICKDMDFPTLGRRYAALGVDALLVPAWDFDRDAWWHARMAILRGVESGFAVIRSARQGLLTVSDRYGRIVDVAASGSAPVATLAVLAPLGAGEATVHARLGDVFGWLCAVASAAAWRVSLRKDGP